MTTYLMQPGCPFMVALMIIMNSPTTDPKSGMTAATYSVVGLYSDLACFTHKPILII
jgi:hypothetical protein